MDMPAADANIRQRRRPPAVSAVPSLGASTILHTAGAYSQPRTHLGSAARPRKARVGNARNCGLLKIEFRFRIQKSCWRSGLGFRIQKSCRLSYLHVKAVSCDALHIVLPERAERSGYNLPPGYRGEPPPFANSAFPHLYYCLGVSGLGCFTEGVVTAGLLPPRASRFIGVGGDSSAAPQGTYLPEHARCIIVIESWGPTKGSGLVLEGYFLIYGLRLTSLAWILHAGRQSSRRWQCNVQASSVRHGKSCIRDPPLRNTRTCQSSALPAPEGRPPLHIRLCLGFRDTVFYLL